MCGYLVDVFCLGVKNAIGPAVIDRGRLPTVIHTLFAAFEELGDPREAPIGLARHPVRGAVDGPYDNTPSVIRTLRKSVGDGNFHYLADAHF